MSDEYELVFAVPRVNVRKHLMKIHRVERHIPIDLGDAMSDVQDATMVRLVRKAERAVDDSLGCPDHEPLLAAADRYLAAARILGEHSVDDYADPSGEPQ